VFEVPVVIGVVVRAALAGEILAVVKTLLMKATWLFSSVRIRPIGAESVDGIMFLETAVL
jgi:hypothetical protein